MAIAEHFFMHGAALATIAGAEEFTALNKASSGKYGHYVVNHDREIFIKYCRREGRAPTPSPSVRTTRNGSSSAAKTQVYLVLVCGHEAIVALSTEDSETLVDMSDARVETVKVGVEPGKWLRVHGPGGELDAIPRNDFPQRVLL